MADIGVMSEIKVPGLETDLREGHSLDCKDLIVGYYRDLYEEISSTVEKVRESLHEWVVDADEDFADVIESHLPKGIRFGKNSALLRTLASVQGHTRISRLSDDEKRRFWAPIAECYCKVQAALTERIVPLEDRELVKWGDTIEVPVQIGTNRIFTRFDRFQYALQRFTDSGSEYRDDLGYLEFAEGYLHGLSSEVRMKLASEKITHLPLKIVSVEYGMITLAEIDEEVFMRGE